MWNLAKTFTMVAVCFAVVDVASAAYRPAPFIGVTVTPDPLHLGEVAGPGLHQRRAVLTAHVVANCPYHIEASFTGLRNVRDGRTIAPKHLSVAINGKKTPVGTGRVTIAQSGRPTPIGGEDIPVDIQVDFVGLPTYSAGRYYGTLVLTVTTRP